MLMQTTDPQYNKDQLNNVSEQIGLDKDPSEYLIRKCYFQWINSDKSFNNKNMNYKQIQKDSMRCYLIYHTIAIKKYLVQIALGVKSG